MLRAAIFAEILSSVSSETEVPEAVIASRNKCTEAVDARYLLVYLLWRRGFYPSMIAPFINHQKRSVSRMLADVPPTPAIAPHLRTRNAPPTPHGGGLITV